MKVFLYGHSPSSKWVLFQVVMDIKKGVGSKVFDFFFGFLVAFYPFNTAERSDILSEILEVKRGCVCVWGSQSIDTVYYAK